jgi:uncharacterized membrane protein YkvA (DUF1232 family)
LSTRSEPAGEQDPRRGGRASRSRGASRTRRQAAESSPAGAAFDDIADSEPTSPRSGAKRTLTETIRELPNYLRLLWGLMLDRRVPHFEKLLVGGAIAYIVMPLDWIPDFIPFLGQIDDVFLLVMSLQRLVHSVGRRVLLDHWGGDPAALEDLNMMKVVGAAAFFLPRRMRRRLRVIGRV